METKSGVSCCKLTNRRTCLLCCRWAEKSSNKYIEAGTPQYGFMARWAVSSSHASPALSCFVECQPGLPSSTPAVTVHFCSVYAHILYIDKWLMLHGSTGPYAEQPLNHKVHVLGEPTARIFLTALWWSVLFALLVPISLCEWMMMIMLPVILTGTNVLSNQPQPHSRASTDSSPFFSSIYSVLIYLSSLAHKILQASSLQNTLLFIPLLCCTWTSLNDTWAILTCLASWRFTS